MKRFALFCLLVSLACAPFVTSLADEVALSAPDYLISGHADGQFSITVIAQEDYEQDAFELFAILTGIPHDFTDEQTENPPLVHAGGRIANPLGAMNSGMTYSVSGVINPFGTGECTFQLMDQGEILAEKTIYSVEAAAQVLTDVVVPAETLSPGDEFDCELLISTDTALPADFPFSVSLSEELTLVSVEKSASLDEETGTLLISGGCPVGETSVKLAVRAEVPGDYVIVFAGGYVAPDFSIINVADQVVQLAAVTVAEAAGPMQDVVEEPIEVPEEVEAPEEVEEPDVIEEVEEAEEAEAAADANVQEEATPFEEQSATIVDCIGRATVREEPDRESKVAGWVALGESVTALERSENGLWYRIRFNEGVEGWISEQMIEVDR